MECYKVQKHKWQMPDGSIKTTYTQEDYLNPNPDWSFPVVDFAFDPLTDEWTPWVGACSAYDKTIDGQVLTSVVWWTVSYTFTSPVSDVSITNITNWVCTVTYTNLIPTTWNGLIPIGPWESVPLNPKESSQTITSISITDIDSTWVGRYLVRWVRF